jgi:hypothetical protein
MGQLVAATSWLTQGGKEGTSLTYAQLNGAAAAAARANPLAHLAPGERVIVAHPPVGADVKAESS